MTEVGIGLPGTSVKSVTEAARAVSKFNFASFSVYGDLGDLPPYATLHACAEIFQNSPSIKIGPLGVPVSMMHPEVIAAHAIALEEQLPEQSYIGLVRGAFLNQINHAPASTNEVTSAIKHVRKRCREAGFEPKVYIGGFGRRILKLSGELKVTGVKLGGTSNVKLARLARTSIGNESTLLTIGAVSVIDSDRRSARTLARKEVAKYLAVVGRLDPTLHEDETSSLNKFITSFQTGTPEAYKCISDDLLDKFSFAGTPEDIVTKIAKMNGIDRVELGTPHGLHARPDAIHNIGKNVLNELRGSK